MASETVDWNRRATVERMIPAETAIMAAVDAVEELPADERLTRAVVLLGEARTAVADYVDGVERRAPTPSPPPASGEEPDKARQEEVVRSVDKQPLPGMYHWRDGWFFTRLPGTGHVKMQYLRRTAPEGPCALEHVVDETIPSNEWVSIVHAMMPEGTDYYDLRRLHDGTVPHVLPRDVGTDTLPGPATSEQEDVDSRGHDVPERPGEGDVEDILAEFRDGFLGFESAAASLRSLASGGGGWSAQELRRALAAEPNGPTVTITKALAASILADLGSGGTGSDRPADPVAAAAEWAARAHAEQVYRGHGGRPDQPYIMHPARVVGALEYEGESAQVVGWLHDVDEDTDAGLPPWLSKDERKALALLTRHKSAQSYTTYIGNILHHSRQEQTHGWIAHAVKLADLRDNLAHDPPPRLRERYEKALETLGGTRSEEGGARELLCDICRRDYPIWSAPNDLWNAVMRDDEGRDQHQFVCPTCFTIRAAIMGVEHAFRVVPATPVSSEAGSDRPAQGGET